MKRLIVAVLALFYVTQSTWLLHAGFDALFPRVAKLVTSDACCASKCGCPEEVRKRGGCCCGPSETSTSPAKTTRASAFDVARCSGLELAMAEAVRLPALAAFPRVETYPLLETELTLPDFTPEVDPRVLDLDKVPL